MTDLVEPVEDADTRDSQAPVLDAQAPVPGAEARVPDAEPAAPTDAADAQAPVLDAQAPVPDVTADEQAPEAAETAGAEHATTAPDGAAPVPDGRAPETRGAVNAGPPRTVGRAVAEALASAGVRFAFAVPGESFLHLLDALPEAGIRVITTRHEGGAAFMAEAVAQLTGQPAACLATRAVGASNLAIGIHTARQDSAPVVALIGQVETRRRGREAFQEADLAGSIGRLAKWSIETSDPAGAVAGVHEGLRRMMGGRPGPVLVTIPEDVGGRPAPADSVGGGAERAARSVSPDPAGVRAVLKLLAGSERGVILAGAGVLRANASAKLVRLAEALAVPVVAAWRRPDVFPNDHPQYLGMTGYGAPASVRRRLEEADAMLVIGSRLSEPSSFEYRIPAARTRWAHVDLEPRVRRAGLRAPDIAVATDAARFLDAAWLDLGGAALDAEAQRRRIAGMARDRASYEAGSVVDAGSWSGPGVHPGRVVATLRRVLSPEAVVTSDAGNFAGWLARGFRFRRPGTFVGPTSGAMGYGLPAAIGVAFARPKRQVVALCGDGGFAMTMSELETAVREGVRVVALVFDNGRYGTIRMHQDRDGHPPVATDLGPIDFAAVARACGADGFTVTSDAEFEPALRAALAAPGPAVVHLALDAGWVSVDDTPLG